MLEGHDYTIYSNGPGGRARMYALIALITAFITPLAQHGVLILIRRYWGDDWDVAESALFMGGFTALILFGLLINIFDAYLWRTRVGRYMFQFAALPAPPWIAGHYIGTILVRSGVNQTDGFQTDYKLRIAQTWEQIAILAERQDDTGNRVAVHSDMATVQIGMVAGVMVLRFVYTFEETLPRRDQTGFMTRQFNGSARFNFSRDGDRWQIDGHFFDDDGKSGQVSLKQIDSEMESVAKSVPEVTSAPAKDTTSGSGSPSQ